MSVNVISKLIANNLFSDCGKFWQKDVLPHIKRKTRNSYLLRLFAPLRKIS